MNKVINKKFFYTAFFCYLLLLVWVTVFKTGVFYAPFWENRIQYPFETELSLFFRRLGIYIRALGTKNHHLAVEYFLFAFFNLLAFVPFGFALPFATSKTKTIITIFCTTFAIETFQLVFAFGGADIVDIATNFVGGLLGLLLYCKVGKKLSAKKINSLFKWITITCIPVCIVAIVSVALIFI